MKRWIFAVLLVLIMVMTPLAFADDVNETDSGDADQEDSDSEDSDADDSDAEDMDSGDSDADEEDADEEDADEEDADEEEDEEELDEDIEEEIEEYDSTSDEEEEELIEEVEEESSTDEEELAEDLDMDEDELKEYQYAGRKIGVKQYILNRQLKHRIMVAGIVSDAITKHLHNMSIDTSELEDIQEQIQEIGESIDEPNMTREEFIAMLGEVKGLVNQYRETLHGLVSDEDLEEIHEAIKEEREAKKDKIEQSLEKEQKARMLYNKRQLNLAMHRINEQVREMKNNGTKLLELAERYREMHEIKERYANGNVTKEDVAQFREEWHNRLQQFSEEREQVQQKNMRILIAKEAKIVMGAVRDARREGADTAGLEGNLSQIRDRIQEMKKINESEFEERAAEIREQIQNAANDSRIADRLEQGDTSGELSRIRTMIENRQDRRGVSE